MQVKYFKRLFTEATTTGDSDIIYNMYADTLGLQVGGTATSLTVNVYGKVTKESDDFVQLGVLNLSDYTSASAISAAGIYEVPVEGICAIKVELAAVSGGNATIDARLVSMGV